VRNNGLFKYIFWDLDGTLTQSEFGVLDSVIYALEKMKKDVPSWDYLKQFIGPPLFYSFTHFCGMSDDEADAAITFYREFYETEGLYKSPLYDGIKDVLDKLGQAGKTLICVTSKPFEMAGKVLENTGILNCFAKIIGPEKSDRNSDKAAMLAKAIKYCSDIEKEDAKKYCVMIGDRHFDMEGAKANDIAALGVLYGYGSRDELVESGADFIAETTGEILKLVL